MSGYNQNWRRRDRDSRASSGRGNQNPNYWSSNHGNYHGNYQNYAQYPFSQYSQQWNWSTQNQFSGSYSQRTSRHVSFNPSQQHGKNTQPNKVPSSGSDSSRNRLATTTPQSKTSSNPHPGSEEARKKTLAQTTDKIKNCLRSFQNEKSDVLENLLSGGEKESDAESSKASSVQLEVTGQELKLTPSDLKVIGMVNVSGSVGAIEEEEEQSEMLTENEPVTVTATKGITVGNISENESKKETVSNSEIHTVELQQNNYKSVKNKDVSSKEIFNTSDSVPSFNTSLLETVFSDIPHANSEQQAIKILHSSSGGAEADHPNIAADLKQSESTKTLQNLKQRIIQQFLKMGKNNLKDIINNPRSRKFEFAMDHLMKEHRKVLSRELRGLAQARIKGQDPQVQSYIAETTSLLDTDVAINLSHLPQELIEQLGNLLQLDLLDSAAVSEEFQPNMAVVEEESKYNVMQNIETLQVALMSEANIKKENTESMQVDNEAKFASQEVGSETNTKGQNESMQNFQSDNSVINQPLVPVQQQVVSDDREIVHEEGNVTHKSRKTSSEWCPYIPLGKGFMNRGEFGSLFCEFPDFIGMESAGSDEQENSIKDLCSDHVEETELCNQPSPTKLLGDVSLGKTTDDTADPDKETLEQNLIAESDTPAAVGPVEEGDVDHSAANVSLNPFEDLHIPTLDADEKNREQESEITALKNTTLCRETNENEISASEDTDSTRMQESDISDITSGTNRLTAPEDAEEDRSQDAATKNILELEKTLAQVDESVTVVKDSNKEPESEGIEFGVADAETANLCDSNDVSGDHISEEISRVKSPKAAGNTGLVDDNMDTSVNNETETNSANKEASVPETPAGNTNVDIILKPNECNSETHLERNVTTVESGEIQGHVACAGDVELNYTMPEGTENAIVQATTEKENICDNSDLQLEDEVVELYRCNIVVKTEKADLETQQRNREEPVQEMKSTAEISVQTEALGELDSVDFQRFLHNLERSSHLPLQLVKFLKDHFSNRGSSELAQVMEREQASLNAPASSGLCMFMPIPPGVPQHVRQTNLRGSRGFGGKGKRKIQSNIGSQTEELSELTGGEQDLGTLRNALDDAGSSNMNCTSKNINPEDILPLAARRDPSTVSKFVFLKMLEIDKEIQKLMELKLDLYKKLQVALEMDPSSLDQRGSSLLNSTDFAESSLSKETAGSLGSQVVLGKPEEEEMNVATMTVNDSDTLDNSVISSKSVPSCSANLAPMVMLPMDYVLSHQSSNLQTPQSARQKLKTFDTSVVEAVLNSFDIPETESFEEKDQTKTSLEGLPQSASRSRRSSQMSATDPPNTSVTTNKRSSVKSAANKKKTTAAMKNAGKYKLAESLVCLENSGADEGDGEIAIGRDLRRRKPEEKITGGRNTRLRASISKPEEDEQLLGNSSFQEENKERTETSEKMLENDEKRETGMKIKPKRISENIPDKTKIQRNKKENKPAEEITYERTLIHSEDNLQPKATRNRRESKKIEVFSEEIAEIGGQKNRKDGKKGVEAEQITVETDDLNKKLRGSKQRAILAINTYSVDESPSKNSRKRKGSIKSDNFNESEQEEESSTPATRVKTRSPKKYNSDQEYSQSESESAKKMKLQGGSDACVEFSGRRSTRTSLSSSELFTGRKNSHSETAEDTYDFSVKRQTGVKRKLEDASLSAEKIPRISKSELEAWNMPHCYVIVHPLPKEQVKSLRDPVYESSETEVKDSNDEISLREQEKKEKKKTLKKRQSSKSNLQTCQRIVLTEDVAQEATLIGENEEDPLSIIADASEPPELQSESYTSAVSSPLQTPPDLSAQVMSPRTNTVLEPSLLDENSISTLVSDSVSVVSDGDQSFSRKNRSDASGSGEYKDDCDRDSLHSCDAAQETKDGANGRASKHKSSKRHKKDIERLTFEAHQGPILDIKTVGRHVLAASEDGFVYCYSLKSGKFKRKYGGHDSAVTCLCVVECCIEPDVTSELEGGEQVTPELFFTGSLDKHLRYFRFKTGELVQPPVNIGSPIQCMDQNWGILFIGTKVGEVIQYNIKLSSIIGEEPLKLGRDSILSLKATKEGPRNVLIIGTRNKPITIRDASSGLLLRSINSSWSHTVYSLVLNANEVYCGTKSGIIPVIQFQNGEQIYKFKTGAGVVCMRIYNNLLFAGCYDGNIYVFSIHDKKQVSCIPGPGKMLLCLDIVKNRIIVGSKDGNKLEAWGFPQDVRNHVKEAKHR